ncbi:MAG TPA: RsmD family RNA methyltransferase [Acidimicrobiales bacterium]|nr:RsmD family RNA methyltransferase [Acidimicrobiales bacterium]
MRVIAGEKGGRRLVPPPGLGTRPTADRVREAAFSMLQSQLDLGGRFVWDLFAGSGAMGIEALSRGAAHAIFVDAARPAVSAVKANLARLGYGPGRADVICADALKWVHGLDGPPPAPAVPGPGDPSPEDLIARLDLVLADPPYTWQAWPALLEGLSPRAPLVLMESSEAPELPPPWEAVKVKRYGTTLLTLAWSPLPATVEAP